MLRKLWVLMVVGLVGCGASAGPSLHEQVEAAREQIEETARINHDTIASCKDTIQVCSSALDQCIASLRTSSATVDMLTLALIRTQPTPLLTP